jgi:hypothetical protein
MLPVVMQSNLILENACIIDLPLVVWFYCCGFLGRGETLANIDFC